MDMLYKLDLIGKVKVTLNRNFKYLLISILIMVYIFYNLVFNNIFIIIINLYLD